MSEKPILGILLGNSAGVGPELVAMLALALAGVTYELWTWPWG